MTRGIFKSAWSLQTATMQPGKWQDEHRPLVDERGRFGRAGSPLPAVRPNAKADAHGVARPTGCSHGAGRERGVAGVLADGHQVNYAVKVGWRCRAAGRAAARPYHSSWNRAGCFCQAPSAGYG